MYNKNLKLDWEKYHSNYDKVDFQNKYIVESWHDSRKHNIDFHNDTPVPCSETEIVNERKLSRDLYINANDVLRKSFSGLNVPNTGFGLITKECCLAELYGDDDFLSICSENKIHTFSYWNEDLIGTNAIALGTQYKIPINTIGTEHYCQFAINLAICYQPIFVEDGSGYKEFYGGIVLIAPADEYNNLFTTILGAISREISLHAFWIKRLNILSNITDGYGLLVLDQSTGKNHILVIGESIFNILNIPNGNYYYETLDKFIDPLPLNKEFWDIINRKQNVMDTVTTISVNKRNININISTSTFVVERYHINGVAILFSTTQRIKSIVSKFSGNFASLEFKDIVTRNEHFMDLLKISQAAASTDSSILILGESGVGKDILAQAIHNGSNRKSKPFVVVNCASFSKELIASELFGYEEGSFTGAKKGGKIGKFELAHTGTIFLDEIGDMPLDLQATMLRVVEQQGFMKIGGNTVINVDVKIIAATNKNLQELIKQKLFREDLYYRLGVIRLYIPPLRERKEDISILTEYFIKVICKRINKPLIHLSDEIIDFFFNYHWPGNVRELRNLLEGIIQIYDGKRIEIKDIKNYLDMSFDKYDIVSPQETTLINTKKIEINHESILSALKLNNNNRTETAVYLGISRRTLYRYLEKFNIS